VKMEEKKRRREQLMKPSPEMEHERGVFVDDGEEIPADRGGEKKKKKPKRKTRSQRNKEKRRRLEAFMEAKQRAEAKRKEALKSLPEVVQEIEEEEEGREEYIKAKLKRRQELRDRRMRQGRVRREKKLEAYLLDDEIPQSMLETAHPFGSAAPMRDMYLELEGRRLIEPTKRQRKRKARVSMWTTNDAKGWSSKFV